MENGILDSHTSHVTKYEGVECARLKNEVFKHQRKEICRITSSLAEEEAGQDCISYLYKRRGELKSTRHFKKLQVFH